MVKGLGIADSLRFDRVACTNRRPFPLCAAFRAYLLAKRLARLPTPFREPDFLEALRCVALIQDNHAFRGVAGNQAGSEECSWKRSFRRAAFLRRRYQRSPSFSAVVALRPAEPMFQRCVSGSAGPLRPSTDA